MKFGNGHEPALDGIDLEILRIIQEDCKVSLTRVGQKVGLSPPSVIERIKKLESEGYIRGYHASLDSRRLGLDVTAFIGVVVDGAEGIGDFEAAVAAIQDVLECHHVTGQHTLLLKVKTRNTRDLEQLISRIRSMEGVAGTETMVVLSTHTERVEVALPPGEPADDARRRKRARRKPDPPETQEASQPPK